MKNLSLKMNWMSIVMLLSLGVNFFVIGYLYAQHKGKEIRMTRLSFDHSISKLVDPFPRKAKHDFYVTMRGKRDELIPIYKRITDQRANIMAIVAEEQVDAEKLQTAMQEYHDIYHDLVVPSQDVIIKILGDLSLEERQAILEQYKNPPRSRWGRDRNDNDKRRGSYSRDGNDKKDDDDKDDNDDHDW